MSTSTGKVDEQAVIARHESEGTRLSALVKWAIALLVSLGVFVLLMFWMGSLFLDEYETELMPPPLPRLNPASTGPTIIEDIAAIRHVLYQQQEARLQSQGWVDREAGVAHIPLQRAMELAVERGLPDFSINAPADSTVQQEDDE